LAFAALPTAAGAAARPDRSFGQSGWVTTKLPGTSTVAYAATVTGGRVVAAGRTSTKTGKGQIVVARFRRNGRPDRSFGSDGVFETSLPNRRGPYIANAIAPAGSGKLLVAGGFGGTILVLRVTRDGRLDRSFGKAGIATLAVGGIGQSIAVQRDGGILIGSSDSNTNGRPMVVARLTPDGARDSSFGDQGIATTLFWDADMQASAGVGGLATAPDGTVTGFGHVDFIGGGGGGGSAGVFQLSGAGEPVPGFGTDGHAAVAFGDTVSDSAPWLPCAFGVDGEGRITVTGSGSVGSKKGILTARLDPAGMLDPSYGEDANGRVFTPGGRGDSFPQCGATVSANGTLTAGVGSTLAQLTPAGSPNPRFGRGGIVKVTKPRGVGINAVAPSGRSRVVVAGSARNSLYVARYLLP
jgi:uncharacterized delta-60 repeat protein